MPSEQKRAGGMAAVCGVMLIFCLGQGCPPAGNGGTDPLPGAGTIRSVEVNGAVVGATGLIRVTLVDPVSAATQVSLASSNPWVAAVPDTVTVPEGSTTGEANYTGGIAGSALVTASLGSSLEYGNADVVPAIALSDVYTAGSMAIGATGYVSVSLNIYTSAPVTVNLTSSNPGVVTVPASITVPAYEDWAAVPVTGLTSGSAVITATLGTSTESTTLRVVGTIGLDDAYVPNERLVVGATESAYVYFNVVLASDQIVNVTSSNLGVVSVPPSAVASAGGSSASFPLVAAAPGTATITATYGSESRTLVITVVAAARPSVRTSGDRYQTGASVDLSVQLDAICGSDTTVNLSSSNGAVLTVPATVSIAAGKSGITLSLPAGTPGGTVIIGSTTGGSGGTEVFVVTAPQLRTFSAGGASEPGIAIDVQLSLDAAPAADVLAAITNSAPTVIAVPSTVVFPANNGSVWLPFRTLAPGTAILSVTIPGSTQTTTVTVVASAGISTISLTTPRVGQPAQVTVLLTATPATDKLVTITNSNPAALSLPAFSTMLIHAGSVSGNVPALGLVPAPGVLTATLGATNDPVNYNVLP